jgi:hypothetical protein
MPAVDVKALWTGWSLSPRATPARARGSQFPARLMERGSCGGLDLTDLWIVDAAIAEDIQTVIQLIAVSHEYPTVYAIGPGSSG